MGMARSELVLTLEAPTSFVAVQAAVVMLMLLFTFARSESPLALAFSGENAFNADKQMQVKDVKVVSGAVLVRLKASRVSSRTRACSAPRRRATKIGL